MDELDLQKEIYEIIQKIEKGNGLWYATPWVTVKESVLTVRITSYNMGVIDYLPEIRAQIIELVKNIPEIKAVDVYWEDTLPGWGNLGIKR